MACTILDQLDTFGPEQCRQLNYEQAAAYTRHLAQSHYENFTVVSWLLPGRLRDHFRHVYAFCRCADDLSDETGDRERSIELLNWWRRELDDCYDGRPHHPVFVALRPTIVKHDIPRKPFDDLIDAFIQDQTVTRYKSWDQVTDYCTRSADPVGRMVLYLCGYRDKKRQHLSDCTCTALQLTNFWQDVKHDALQRDRVYIPQDVAGRHGLDMSLMVQAIRIEAAKPKHCATCTTETSPGIRAILAPYRATVKELIDKTRPFFAKGSELWPLVASDVRLDIKLFSMGGQSLLRNIERLNYDTLQVRPVLGRSAKLMLMFRAVTGKLQILAGGPEATDA